MNTILTESSNENTSPERLRDIFEYYREDEIKKALTSNPNTPLDILFILGEDYPLELLGNPALDLYLLSNPNLLMEIPEGTLISILALPQVPIEFINFALNNRKEPKILATIILKYPKKKVNLRGANLKFTDLSGANLTDTNLNDANLRGTDLSNANLRNTKLRNTALYKANLSGADLTNADLRGADLYQADLYQADLRGADLYQADLRNTDLTNADLTNADLYYPNDMR